MEGAEPRAIKLVAEPEQQVGGGGGRAQNNEVGGGGGRYPSSRVGGGGGREEVGGGKGDKGL